MHNPLVPSALPLVASGLGKRFGRRWIFRHLEIELSAGDVLVVTGANGAGKSTLLKVLAGLESASEGTVARPGTLGYAALDLAVYAGLSGREHLAWAGAMRGVPAREAELAALFGMEAFFESPTSTYSSGQRSRLRLALAEQPSPDLLLLDEPSAALDDEGRAVVDRLIAGRRGSATVIATNDPRDHGFATQMLAL